MTAGLTGVGRRAYRSVDPDAVRDAACDATASVEVCDPPATVPSEPFVPAGGGSGAGGGTGIIGTLLVVVLVVALVVVLAWLVRSWWLTRHDEVPADDEIDDADESLGEIAATREIDDRNPPDRWRRRAEEHRRASRFRDAVRCEYRALVGDLARAGLVDEIPGRTSGEERFQVAALAADLSSDFDTAADLFDRAWFDDDAVTADDDERFATIAQGLSEAAGRRRGDSRSGPRVSSEPVA